MRANGPRSANPSTNKSFGASSPPRPTRIADWRASGVEPPGLKPTGATDTLSYVRPDQLGFGNWSATGVGTNAGVTVTHTIGTGATICEVVGIQASGDAAALVTIESPAGTVIYRKRFAAAFTLSEGFGTPKKGALSQNVLVKISASTSNCEANIDGYDH